MRLIFAIIYPLRAFFADRSQLALENLALRQQLAVYRRTIARPTIRSSDRLFWTLLANLWRSWPIDHREARDRDPLAPCWLQAFLAVEVSRRRPRSSADTDGCDHSRIQAELRLLGYAVSESTVAKYTTARGRRPPSQRWRTFLDNHINQIAACDFFVVPTATFSLLWCFVVLSHDRRRIVHFNVTSGPSAEWTAQQMIEAFPADGPIPRFLLRDRDSIYGEKFRSRLAGMRIAEVITAYRSPWQNPYAERVIGTIRRECTDHLIVIGENHLRRLIKEYVRYYNDCRPHSALAGNSPLPRDVEPPERGTVVSNPVLGGLHHRYRRAA